MAKVYSNAHMIAAVLCSKSAEFERAALGVKSKVEQIAEKHKDNRPTRDDVVYSESFKMKRVDYRYNLTPLTDVRDWVVYNDSPAALHKEWGHWAVNKDGQRTTQVAGIRAFTKALAG